MAGISFSMTGKGSLNPAIYRPGFSGITIFALMILGRWQELTESKEVRILDNKKAENNQKQDNYNCYNQPGIEFEFLFFAGIFFEQIFSSDRN